MLHFFRERFFSKRVLTFNYASLQTCTSQVSPFHRILLVYSVGYLAFLTKNFANIITPVSRAVSAWLPSISRTLFQEWLFLCVRTFLSETQKISFDRDSMILVSPIVSSAAYKGLLNFWL